MLFCLHVAWFVTDVSEYLSGGRQFGQTLDAELLLQCLRTLQLTSAAGEVPAAVRLTVGSVNTA